MVGVRAGGGRRRRLGRVVVRLRLQRVGRRRCRRGNWRPRK
uniref:Uncharacterized protein n=1 Tax=Rhizophora mucronata TaxID=61149 RepID=A0A2P2PVI4_RHIMU